MVDVQQSKDELSLFALSLQDRWARFTARPRQSNHVRSGIHGRNVPELQPAILSLRFALQVQHVKTRGVSTSG